jgi:glycosyltransferase involved in cell wall biosynthesis
MNILIISHFFPPHKGGVEIASFYTAKNLSELGHNVYVLTSIEKEKFTFNEKTDFKLFRYKSYNLPEIKGFPQSLNFGIIFKAIWKLPKIIKKYNIQIIHLEGRFFPISLITAILNHIIFKRIIILSVQGRLSGGFTPLIEIFYDSVINKVVYSHLDKIICVSKSLETHMIESGINKKKLEVIYNGVDTKFFTKLDSVNIFDDLIDSDNHYKKVIFVGRLDHQKGVEYLIKSVPYVREKYNNVFFFYTWKW